MIPLAFCSKNKTPTHLLTHSFSISSHLLHITGTILIVCRGEKTSMVPAFMELESLDRNRC